MKGVITMKRWIGLMLMLILVLTNTAKAEEEGDGEAQPFIAEIYAQESGNAEDDGEWKTQPVITEAYEQESGKIYLGWTGKASVYQVYVDGKLVQSTEVASALIAISRGSHTIKIVPASKEDGSDINVAAFSFSLGFTMKDTTTGTPSEPFSFDYIPDSLLSAALAAPSAQMTPDNVMLLSFNDKFKADEYLITVRDGSETDYIRFFPRDDARNEQISIGGSVVTVRLDPAYLLENGYAQIELGKQYSFTVKLRKHTTSMLNGETISSVIHESKESKELVFSPFTAWSAAPVITKAEQTGEGQVLLQWAHDPGANSSCEYEVMLASKVLMVKTAETAVATTSDKEAVLRDLADGEYSYTIVPIFGGKKGTASAEANVTVKNTWNAEPKLTLSQVANNQVKLEWTAALSVEAYHIRVFVGDSKSLLQFVDMDYKQYQEFDVPVTGDMLNTTFSYDGEMDPEKGTKLKFEIWGIKHAANGEELTTKTGSQSITIKP